jgi:hypothetical protein
MKPTLVVTAAALGVGAACCMFVKAIRGAAPQPPVPAPEARASATAGRVSRVG